MHVRTPAAIGAVIRARRRELKLGQAVLAARVGTTRQWLIAIEKGKATAELGLVLRTLNALQLILDIRAEGEAGAPMKSGPGELPRIDIDKIVNSAKRSPRS